MFAQTKDFPVNHFISQLEFPVSRVTVKHHRYGKNIIIGTSYSVDPWCIYLTLNHKEYLNNLTYLFVVRCLLIDGSRYTSLFKLWRGDRYDDITFYANLFLGFVIRSGKFQLSLDSYLFSCGTWFDVV